jgi:hypothetical protein
MSDLVVEHLQDSRTVDVRETCGRSSESADRNALRIARGDAEGVSCDTGEMLIG